MKQWPMQVSLAILAAAAIALLPKAVVAQPIPPGFGTAGPEEGITRIKLYDTTPNVVAGRETESNPMEPTLDLYIPDSDKATGAGVLILPGGGYQMLTLPGEGPEPAKFFLSHNVAAFVLRYRHGPQYHYPTTLQDAQRAIRLIRTRAEEFHVDPEKLGVFRALAGGHLAAMMATLYDNSVLPEAPYVADSTDSLSQAGVCPAVISGDRPDRRCSHASGLAKKSDAKQPGAV